MRLTDRHTGEYGYNIVLTADTDLSTATTVVIKARVKGSSIVKTLTGTVSPATVFTATVPQDFFDIAGIWELQLQATFASSVRYQRDFLEIKIKKGIE